MGTGEGAGGEKRKNEGVEDELPPSEATSGEPLEGKESNEGAARSNSAPTNDMGSNGLLSSFSSTVLKDRDRAGVPSPSRAPGAN